MTTSEPTTGELIKTLREDANKQESLYHVCDSTMNAKIAADRLESQQREIATLTARAEQAEATTKAIVDVIDSGSVVCTICANRVGWDTCKPCKFKMRGLPQEGDVE